MIYGSYFYDVGCDRCALSVFAFYAYMKAQHDVSEIQIIFSMSGYDKFYGSLASEEILRICNKF